LDTILDRQEQLELVINEQNNKIVELGRREREVDPPIDSKKGKGKLTEFYYVNIYDTVIVNVLHYIYYMPFLTLIIA
jgi:hypothetical protein